MRLLSLALAGVAQGDLQFLDLDRVAGSVAFYETLKRLKRLLSIKKGRPETYQPRSFPRVTLAKNPINLDNVITAQTESLATSPCANINPAVEATPMWLRSQLANPQFVPA